MNLRSIFFIFISFVLFSRCALFGDKSVHPEIIESYQESLKTLHHSCFTIGYDEYRKHAAYVHYSIEPPDLEGIAKRKNNFKPDPLVIRQFSADNEDYYKSGFDRGHLCPAADMKVSQSCMDESFYYSNISPQVPGFNRGVWKKLENQVREWCVDSDSLRIYTGPIFHESDTTLGANNVIVPQKYYKTILRHKNDSSSMIGFILNNESSNNELSTFMKSVDYIEEMINLDLYGDYPDDLEMKLEKSISKIGWFN